MINEIEIRDILNQYNATDIVFDYRKGILEFTLLKTVRIKCYIELFFKSNFNLHTYIYYYLENFKCGIDDLIKGRVEMNKKINYKKLEKFITRGRSNLKMIECDKKIIIYTYDRYERVPILNIDKVELEGSLKMKRHRKKDFLESAILDNLIAHNKEFMEEETNE